MWYYLTKYQHLPNRNAANNILLFIFDPSRNHPGLMDRLKACVGIYNIAKRNNRNFKILFEPGSYIPDYIEPNMTNWQVEKHDISYSMYESRLISYTGREDNVFLNSKIRQYHVYNYRGLDLRLFLRIYNCEELWSKDFNELFRPSKTLYTILQNQQFKENEYIAVHVRFVNALELAEPKYPVLPLPIEKKHLLIEKCIKAIKSIEKDNNLPVLIFSDSSLFLKKCGMEEDLGKIGHISYNTSREVYEKTFTDLFMISRARMVIQLQDNNLYRSAFSRFGAMIGNKPFVFKKI